MFGTPITCVSYTLRGMVKAPQGEDRRGRLQQHRRRRAGVARRRAAAAAGLPRVLRQARTGPLPRGRVGNLRHPDRPDVEEDTPRGAPDRQGRRARVRLWRRRRRVPDDGCHLWRHGAGRPGRTRSRRPGARTIRTSSSSGMELEDAAIEAIRTPGAQVECRADHVQGRRVVPVAAPAERPGTLLPLSRRSTRSRRRGAR
jgi:hypothetical protein